MMNKFPKRFMVAVCLAAALLGLGLFWIQYINYQKKVELRNALVMRAAKEVWNLSIRSVENEFQGFAHRTESDQALKTSLLVKDKPSIDARFQVLVESCFPETVRDNLIVIRDLEGMLIYCNKGQVMSDGSFAFDSDGNNTQDSFCSEYGYSDVDGPVLRLRQLVKLSDHLDWLLIEIPLIQLIDSVQFDDRIYCGIQEVREHGDHGTRKTVSWSLEAQKLDINEGLFPDLDAADSPPSFPVSLMLRNNWYCVNQFSIQEPRLDSLIAVIVLDNVDDFHDQFRIAALRSFVVLVVAVLLLLVMIPKYFSRYESKIRTAEDTLANQVREREKTLEKLEEREEMFRNLFESSPIPMIQMDYDTEIEDQIQQWYSQWKRMNPTTELISFREEPALVSLLSQARIECINTAAKDFFAVSRQVRNTSNISWLVETTDDEFKTALVRLISKNRSFSSFESEIVPSYGAKRSAVVDFSVIESREDHESIIVTFQDITEQKREHELALAAKEEAEEANRLKSSFLSNMSHELKTPLNAIIGFSDLLADNTTDPIAQEQLRLIQHSGRHLLSIIKDILELTRIDSDRSSVNFSLFGLQEFVSDFLCPQYVVANDRGVVLTHLTESLPSTFVFSDQSKLHHILSNIMNNAFKFTKEGSIDISATIELLGPTALNRIGDFNLPLQQELVRVVSEEFETPNEATLCRLHFSISDTGTGISEEMIRKIFDPFFQGDQSSTRRYGGTGLGLTVCRKLIQLLNGTINCLNRKEGGTLVEFSIYGISVSSEDF